MGPHIELHNYYLLHNYYVILFSRASLHNKKRTFVVFYKVSSTAHNNIHSEIDDNEYDHGDGDEYGEAGGEDSSAAALVVGLGFDKRPKS